ncbi:hypothetical protein TYRP_021773 [Tyrophagus putrescentiae]|nr:hypothetical protein TYRP_021773 [Tyrophagus putrescentiae]
MLNSQAKHFRAEEGEGVMRIGRVNAVHRLPLGALAVRLAGEESRQLLVLHQAQLVGDPLPARIGVEAHVKEASGEGAGQRREKAAHQQLGDGVIVRVERPQHRLPNVDGVGGARLVVGFLKVQRHQGGGFAFCEERHLLQERPARVAMYGGVEAGHLLQQHLGGDLLQGPLKRMSFSGAPLPGHRHHLHPSNAVHQQQAVIRVAEAGPVAVHHQVLRHGVEGGIAAGDVLHHAAPHRLADAAPMELRADAVEADEAGRSRRVDEDGGAHAQHPFIFGCLFAFFLILLDLNGHHKAIPIDGHEGLDGVEALVQVIRRPDVQHGGHVLGAHSPDAGRFFCLSRFFDLPFQLLGSGWKASSLE